MSEEDEERRRMLQSDAAPGPLPTPSASSASSASSACLTPRAQLWRELSTPRVLVYSSPGPDGATRTEPGKG